METLGERLRTERKRQKKTQPELGKVAGVSKQAIGKIENGITQKPVTSTLEPIARYLGVNLRWLMEGRGEKHIARPQ